MSCPRYVVRSRPGRGGRFKVIDTATSEIVRASTTRAGAENQAAALNAKQATA